MSKVNRNSELTHGSLDNGGSAVIGTCMYHIRFTVSLFYQPLNLFSEQFETTFQCIILFKSFLNFTTDRYPSL